MQWDASQFFYVMSSREGTAANTFCPSGRRRTKLSVTFQVFGPLVKEFLTRVANLWLSIIESFATGRQQESR